MIDQIGIAFTGATAVWLSQDHRQEYRKWACIFGLLGQPFWFYSAFVAEQWGIFALCFLYALSWAKGFKNNWMTS